MSVEPRNTFDGPGVDLLGQLLGDDPTLAACDRLERALTRSVGGFDNGPCHLCERETPCGCGGRDNCACTCGRCLYPYPLPDDGPLR